MKYNEEYANGLYILAGHCTISSFCRRSIDYCYITIVDRFYACFQIEPIRDAVECQHRVHASIEKRQHGGERLS